MLLGRHVNDGLFYLVFQLLYFVSQSRQHALLFQLSTTLTTILRLWYVIHS